MSGETCSLFFSEVNLVTVYLMLEGLPKSAIGLQSNNSYTFNISSRKEYTHRLLS